MRLKQIFIILCLSVFFLSALFSIVFPAASQEQEEIISNWVLDSPEDKMLAASDYFVNSIESPLEGTVVSTKTIESYIPFKKYQSHFSAEITGMTSSTYTWHFDNYPPDTIDVLSFDWEGGSGCIQEPNNNIVCGSGITYFYIEYRFSSSYSPTSNFLSIGAGVISSGYSPNNIITLNYVEPLTFITSTLYLYGDPIEPLLHDGTTLKWETPDGIGPVAAKFYDPRISVVYLPIAIK